MESIKFNKKSLKFKITISSLVIVLLSTLLLAVISYNVISQKLQNQLKEDGMNLVEEISSEISTNNNVLNQVDKLLGEKIISAAYLVGENPNHSNESLTEIAKTINVQEINVVNADGVVINSNLATNINYKYPTDHAIQRLLKGESNQIIEKIRKSSSSSDQNYYKYGAVALKGGGIVQVGVIANEVEKLSKDVEDQTLLNRLGKSPNIVYALTIDTNLKAAAHTDKSRIGITLDDEGSKTAIKDGKPYSSVYNYKGQEKVYDVILPIKDANGKVTKAIDIGVSLKNQFNALKSIVIYFAIASILIVVISGIILIRAISRNLKPLDKLICTAESVSQGDLTNNIEVNTEDEIGDLGISFNNMVDNLKNITTKINEVSNNLADSSKELLLSTQQVSQVSSEISNSTQEVANGAEKQVRATDAVSVNMKNVVKNITTIQEQIGNVMNSSDDTSRLASDGREKMGNMVKQINIIKDSVNYSSKVIEELQKTSKEIGNIVEIIDGIADQTNLLALNASIEAARAGEAGKGFAVVAEEVRKLAEESMRSSNSIKDLIITTQQKTDKALISIEEGNRESEKGHTIVQVVGTSLNEILKSFDATRINLEKVNEIINNSKESIDTMSSNINEIQAIATNTAASTEEVAASTEEQNAVLQQVNASVEQLTEMAVKLEDSIKIFKL
ncbi:methyl-accepting chemotaxis protein [Clostridium thailandense]|uniref:methyl-accepting chemotaxis protein n=1 Tax=Clostridium thailandense TaxID=2794346 RepID=UPI001FE8F4B4|nr:methyl-accepting chemotaxis protein [Clostridium thailandense]